MTGSGKFRAALKRGERTLRDIRDGLFVKPLARSRAFKRHYELDHYAIVVDCGDHRLACDPKDRVIGATVDHSRQWFRLETLSIFDALPVAGKVFVDVGANIGTQTVYALMFGGFEKAICIEPSPKNAALLRVNLAINGLSCRATVVEAAAGARQGRAELSLSAHNGGGHSMAYHRGSETIEVDVVTVDETLASLGVAPDTVGLGWVDVEGYEAEVLAGWRSLAGTPIMVECQPCRDSFPMHALSGYRRWAHITGTEIRWRNIGEFDPASHKGEVDLLFS